MIADIFTGIMHLIAIATAENCTKLFMICSNLQNNAESNITSPEGGLIENKNY